MFISFHPLVTSQYLSIARVGINFKFLAISGKFRLLKPVRAKGKHQQHRKSNMHCKIKLNYNELIKLCGKCFLKRLRKHQSVPLAKTCLALTDNTYKTIIFI